MAVAVAGSDVKSSPDGYILNPHYGELQLDNATGITLTAPAAATTIAAASNGFTAGLQNPASTANGPVISATGGTFTAVRAGNYRVLWSFSDVTPSAAATNTIEVYKNSTASGGKVVVVQGAAAQFLASSVATVTLAVGDVVTVKYIASTGNVTIKRGAIVVTEV